jgi:putative hemolysin
MTEALSFIGLLLLSCFFSGSETAFFAISKLQLKDLQEEDTPGSDRVAKLLNRPQYLLTTILVGNTISNTAAATLAALVSHRMAINFGISPELLLFIDIVVVTAILLIFSEVTPKIFAIRNPVDFARLASFPLRISLFLLTPLVYPVYVITQTLKKKIQGVDHRNISGDDLRTLIEIEDSENSLEEDEKKMISSIFEFGETTVREVMIPRIDMICLPHDATLDDAVTMVRKEGHSRIPMYKDRVDNIIGILFAKDLISFLQNAERDMPLEKLVRQPYFVPEGKMIDELMHEFQTGRIHMAIVVDEYGGTAGIVTMEDVLEEIVGEIQDEFDNEAELFQKTTDGHWLIDSQMELEDTNELLGDEILPTDEEYESFGGFIYKLAGEVPKAGSSYLHLDWRFTVMTMKRHRIGRVKAEKLKFSDGDSKKHQE